MRLRVHENSRATGWAMRCAGTVSSPLHGRHGRLLPRTATWTRAVPHLLQLQLQLQLMLHVLHLRMLLRQKVRRLLLLLRMMLTMRALRRTKTEGAVRPTAAAATTTTVTTAAAAATAAVAATVVVRTVSALVVVRLAEAWVARSPGVQHILPRLASSWRWFGTIVFVVIPRRAALPLVVPFILIFIFVTISTGSTALDHHLGNFFSSLGDCIIIIVDLGDTFAIVGVSDSTAILIASTRPPYVCWLFVRP